MKLRGAALVLALASCGGEADGDVARRYLGDAAFRRAVMVDSLELEPGESTAFRVTFQPTDDGRRHAILQIRSNDANENPVIFKLSGLGMR